MIWMISGLHDVCWLQNILANYNRQEYPHRRLIIVENGKGIGVTKNIQLPIGTIVLTSNPGPAEPMNAALHFLKKHRKYDNWFCKCDADDYYGPQYLLQIRAGIKLGADYLGRKSLYIKTTDNHLWYAESKDSDFIFHGPTIAARVGAAVEFPLVQGWGEDAQWCKTMNRIGRKSVILPAEGFCYQRWSNYQHSWPCTDFEIRTLWQVEFLDLGNLDLDVVNGVKERPLGKSLDVPEVDSSNFMPFRILKEKSLSFIGMGIH